MTSRYVKRSGPPPFIKPVGANGYRMMGGGVLMGSGMFSKLKKGFQRLKNSPEARKIYAELKKVPIVKETLSKITGSGRGSKIRLIGTGKGGQGQGILIGGSLWSKIKRAARKVGSKVKSTATKAASSVGDVAKKAGLAVGNVVVKDAKALANEAKKGAISAVKNIRSPADVLDLVNKVKDLPGDLVDKATSMAAHQGQAYAGKLIKTAMKGSGRRRKRV